MSKPSGDTVFWTGAVTAVGAALVAGMFVLGSPMEERARQIDNRRVQDLQSIMAATDLYWTRHSELPSSLEELTAEPGVRVQAADPVSGEAYGYTAVDSIRYELCASFDQESDEIARDPVRDLWAHGPGPQCFPLEVRRIPRRER